ncbi:MAG: acyltransferase [Lachnospiraceae bacterium]|nr:acyltransferase [Lachnospiraceae bacterium]
MQIKKVYAIDFIKALACILIFLYHCNTILPGEWKFLTFFGQDMGNNLFFMVSGFALMPGIVKTPRQKAFFWYLKRLKRILPMTLIAYIASYLTGYYSFKDPAQLFAVFIYPTLYWFITAILVFYVLLFILTKLISAKIRIFICLALAVLYILRIENADRLYVIGFLAMLTGYMVREALEKNTARFSGAEGFALLVAVLIYAAGKVFELSYVDHILSGILILVGVISVGSLALFIGFHLQEKTGKEIGTGLHKAIKYIGDMALPLYLVQCFHSGAIGFYLSRNVKFPLSFLINFVIVWSVGSLLLLIDALISGFILKKTH